MQPNASTTHDAYATTATNKIQQELCVSRYSSFFANQKSFRLSSSPFLWKGGGVEGKVKVWEERVSVSLFRGRSRKAVGILTGARPALLAGTQTSVSLGWIANYLFSFCRAFARKCELRRSVESSSSV